MNKIDYIQESIDKKEESATLYILKQWGYIPQEEQRKEKMSNVVRIIGLEKKLNLNREPEVNDLFLPTFISNSLERYKYNTDKYNELIKKEIPLYAKIHEISIEDAYKNINLIRDVQGLENIDYEIKYFK